MVARVVAVALLLALAVPATAPFSNPRSVPSAASVPDVIGLPSVAEADLPAADTPAQVPWIPEAAPEELACIKAVQVLVPFWTKEATDWRTVTLASLVAAEGGVALDATLAGAEAAAAVPLEGPQALLVPGLEGILPAGTLEAGEEAVAAALAALGLEATLVVDQVYYEWTRSDHVVLLPSHALLPPGLVGVPYPGCLDPTQLATLPPLPEDPLSILLQPRDGWHSGLPRLVVQAETPLLD